jgi:hypothetical protein
METDKEKYNSTNDGRVDSLGRDITKTVVNPTKNITFHNPQGEKIGAFYYEHEQWHFDGEMAESAKVFVKWLQETFDLTKNQK